MYYVIMNYVIMNYTFQILEILFTYDNFIAFYKIV